MGDKIAFEYTVPGIFDRAGNIKFQDFLQFSISASLITQGRAYQRYHDQVLAHEIHAIVGRDSVVFLQYYHGPQVAIPFIPLLSLPYLAQAAIWAAIFVAIYFTCVWLVWRRRCPALRSHHSLVILSTLAYPPLFGPLAHSTHLQLSVIVFAAILWNLYRIAITSHRLAFAETTVV